MNEHYRKTDIQPIELITEWGLDFSLGNVLKYICRAGKKQNASIKDDLMKALWYLTYHLTEDTDVADNVLRVVNASKLD
jgi:hypothetical protein